MAEDPPFTPAPQQRAGWLRWALVAVAIALVGGVVAWLLLKPGLSPRVPAGAISIPAQVNEVDHDDRSKADALVGPSAPQEIFEQPEPAPIEPAATASPTPAPVPAPAPTTEPSKPAPSKPAPAPAKPAPKPERQASPTLKDLLD